MDCFNINIQNKYKQPIEIDETWSSWSWFWPSVRRNGAYRLPCTWGIYVMISAGTWYSKDKRRHISAIVVTNNIKTELAMKLIPRCQSKENRTIIFFFLKQCCIFIIFSSVHEMGCLFRSESGIRIRMFRSASKGGNTSSRKITKVMQLGHVQHSYR